jgi:hypothetical protein
MQEEQFRLLTALLRNMEDEDLKHSDLDGTIHHIIKTFERHLTNEQKNTVIKEILNFEKIRKERMDRVKFIDRMEKEEGRSALYSFFNGDSLGL